MILPYSFFPYFQDSDFELLTGVFGVFSPFGTEGSVWYVFSSDMPLQCIDLELNQISRRQILQWADECTVGRLSLIEWYWVCCRE